MIGWLVVVAVAAGAGWLLGHRRGSAPARRAAATELTAVHAELARKIDEVYALQELSFVLSESLKPERIANRIADYVVRFLAVRGVVVALATDAGQVVRIAAARGSLEELGDRDIPERDAGLLARAMESEHLEMVDRESDVGAPDLIHGTPVDRAAVLPLRALGVTVGALAVANPRDQAFGSEDLRLLSTVATHAAIALSNARFMDLVRSSRDQWETTFNALTEGIAVLDDRGVIRRSNRALAALVGRAVPALTDVPLAATILGGEDDVEDLLRRPRSGMPYPPLTLQSEPLNRTLRLTVAPMVGEGNANWTVVLVEDVTAQLAMEAQLIQNEKMAAVGQLVSGVAHELNNPLTSIAGLAEFLLEQTPAPSPHREHLGVIHEQADRASRIVRNLLAFAREGPVDVVPLDLNDIVRRTVDLVDHEVRLREVQLLTTLGPDLTAVHGDRHQIQQVVLNLLTNAVQAVAENPPDRPRRVEISTVTEGEHVLLRVQDSGPGIPENILPRIFTPFFTTKAAGKGTGLGLSISFRIVQGHGGTMQARAAAAGGAEIVVRLPTRFLDADGRGTQDAGTADAGAGRAAARAGQRYEILLLDGDPAVRRMISVLLADDGSVVTVAQDAEHAVRLLDERWFDLVIADPRAAVTAGERFGDYLLARWPNLRSRTILLTADVRAETQTWLEQLGCQYFVKPFRVGDLKAASGGILAAADPRS